MYIYIIATIYIYIYILYNLYIPTVEWIQILCEKGLLLRNHGWIPLECSSMNQPRLDPRHGTTDMDRLHHYLWYNKYVNGYRHVHLKTLASDIYIYICIHTDTHTHTIIPTYIIYIYIYIHLHYTYIYNICLGYVHENIIGIPQVFHLNTNRQRAPP